MIGRERAGAAIKDIKWAIDGESERGGPGRYADCHGKRGLSYSEHDETQARDFPCVSIDHIEMKLSVRPTNY